MKQTDWVECFRVTRVSLGTHSIGTFKKVLKKSFKMALSAQQLYDSVIILMRSAGWRPNYAHFSRNGGWERLGDLPNISQWAHSRTLYKFRGHVLSNVLLIQIHWCRIMDGWMDGWMNRQYDFSSFDILKGFPLLTEHKSIRLAFIAF